MSIIKINWDNAPEGATHFSTNPLACEKWLKVDAYDVYFYVNSDESWTKYSYKNIAYSHLKNAIERPSYLSNNNNDSLKVVKALGDLEVGMFIKMKNSEFKRQVIKINTIEGNKFFDTVLLDGSNYEYRWAEEGFSKVTHWSYNIDGPYNEINPVATPEVKSEPEWKIRHLRSDDYKVNRDVAVTILYKDIGNGYYEYKYAICNPKDMFSRKEGVRVALAKEDTGKVYLRTGASLFANILLHIAIGNRVSNDFDNLLNNLDF